MQSKSFEALTLQAKPVFNRPLKTHGPVRRLYLGLEQLGAFISYWMTLNFNELKQTIQEMSICLLFYFKVVFEIGF